MKKIVYDNQLLPHLFRSEYSKMTAVLCRHFGLKHIEIAEDIVSETFLKAAESWSINNMPANPTAWLYTVAKNKAKDYLKHLSIFDVQIKEELYNDSYWIEQDYNYTNQIIVDSQLAVIFVVCSPNNSTEVQICLALKILCGFSVEEIANAFLTKTETIKKRLHRGRTNLRNDNFEIKALNENVIKARLDTVLSTIYLLFNEGYFSKSNNNFIRKELCLEAIRLALILTENPLTNTSKVNALLALMCFQSSRLDAREDESGETILYNDQDRRKWDQELINRGNYYLVESCSRNEVSKYHLEAAIAYWYTTPTDDDKWQHILHLYNQLLVIEYSPMIALNRGFVYAKVYGSKKGIDETLKLNLTENSSFHSLLGYLWTEINIENAINHYTIAIKLTKSKKEQLTLSKELIKLIKNNNN